MLRRRSLIAAIAALVLWTAQAVVPQGEARAAATLLPNGENCFQATTGITGMVGLLGTITGGTGGTAGTYGGVALTGGTGSGATANITVAGGAVTAVTILNPGTAYTVGDVLSAASGTIGGTTGFSVPVSSVSINSSLAGGKVYFYQPNTAIFKSTWFNPDQSASHQNTNPVQLDANGCAIIYGTGSYRQVLQDSLGNTVWDQLTTDTSANNNTFWAGLAGGTPNTITVVDAGFNATDGSIINFTAIATNTGPATLNPSSFGAISILKDTTAGPVSLSGGEITQNNPISVIFRASDNAFHLLNPPIQSASGSNAPLCGATGFTIQNDSSAPNTLLDVRATNAVTLSSTGASLNRSNVFVTVNFATTGAGGLDTGSIGASSVYYLYLIDNGAAPAGLASLSSTSPTLPTGYSYKCRLGAIPTNGSSQLFQVLTTGSRTTINQTIPSQFIASAVTGTCFSNFVGVNLPLLPLTATQMFGTVSIVGANSAGVGLSGGATISPALGTGTGGTNFAIYFQLPVIASQTLFYCSNSVSNFAEIIGWVDGVNAN